MIVRDIWQKLSNIERKVSLIVTHFWQLFSRIFGETSLIVTDIWPNLVLHGEALQIGQLMSAQAAGGLLGGLLPGWPGQRMIFATDRYGR